MRKKGKTRFLLFNIFRILLFNETVYINYIIGEILTVGWRFVVVSKCCRQKGKEAKKTQSVGTVDFLRYVPASEKKLNFSETILWVVRELKLFCSRGTYQRRFEVVS